MIYVVISELGLNEHWLHYAGALRPMESAMEKWADQAARTTGYARTILYEVDGENTREIDPPLGGWVARWRS